MTSVHLHASVAVPTMTAGETAAKMNPNESPRPKFFISKIHEENPATANASQIPGKNVSLVATVPCVLMGRFRGAAIEQH